MIASIVALLLALGVLAIGVLILPVADEDRTGKADDLKWWNGNSGCEGRGFRLVPPTES